MSNPSSRIRVAPLFLATSSPRTPELVIAPIWGTLTRSTSSIGIIPNRSGNAFASGYFRHHAASLAATKAAHGASWKALPMAPVGRCLTRSACSAEADGPGASKAHVVNFVPMKTPPKRGLVISLW